MRNFSEELREVIESSEYRGERLVDVPMDEWKGRIVKAVRDTVSEYVRHTREDKWVKKGWKAKVVQLAPGLGAGPIPWVEPMGRFRKGQQDRVVPKYKNKVTRVEIDPKDWVVVR